MQTICFIYTNISILLKYKNLHSQPPVTLNFLHSFVEINLNARALNTRKYLRWPARHTYCFTPTPHIFILPPLKHRLVETHAVHTSFFKHNY